MIKCIWIDKLVASLKTWVSFVCKGLVKKTYARFNISTSLHFSTFLRISSILYSQIELNSLNVSSESKELN